MDEQFFRSRLGCLVVLMLSQYKINNSYIQSNLHTAYIYVDRDGWVPWDVQAVNASPNVILWSKLSTSILIRVPGLYRYATVFLYAYSTYIHFIYIKYACAHEIIQ